MQADEHLKSQDQHSALIMRPVGILFAGVETLKLFYEFEWALTLSS